MGAFRGREYLVSEMKALPNEDAVGVASDVGVLHTAKAAAGRCVSLLAKGDSLGVCWRFGVLQTLDDYESTLRRGGAALAAGVFEDRPELTGAVELDASFAALAEYLAERDGWPVPDWAADPARVVPDRWYTSVPSVDWSEADRATPPAFRSRGLRITSRTLARA